MPKENDYDPEALPDLLPIYYKRLFPYSLYYKWLSYGGIEKTVFTHREMSFTLKDDVYIRYQSFQDESELEKEIQKKCPYKIDIGAIFTHRPRDHRTVKAAAFQPKEKEIVFDIDMTDYDEVRFCCQGADICLKCWPLMIIAAKIIDAALRDDFGYQHLLWVYSGRRGIHCWVCDEGARKTSGSVRSAVAEYLSVVKGGDSQIKKVTLHERSIHPSIQRAIKIIEEHFEQYAVDKQDFLGTSEKMDKVLALIPDEAVRERIREIMDKNNVTSSALRWKAICTTLESSKVEKLRVCKYEIMLQYVYPRLDVNVSKGVNHLLKSPFCIHPKTGRICVPMDITNIDKFDPFQVPTISQVIDEMNISKVEETEDGQKRVRDYKKTSMNRGVQTFKLFLDQLEKTWIGLKIEKSDTKMEF